MKRLNATVLSVILVLLVSMAIMFLPKPSFAYTLPGCDPPGGAIVWGGYCQNQLDILYDQNYWKNDPADTTTRSTTQNADLLARFGPPERIFYGDVNDDYAEYEYLNLYRAKQGGNAPILIYIHGGAWRGGSAATSMVPAEMFTEAGAHFIALDFVNVLQTDPPGNIMEMALEVRKAIAWVYKNAHKFKGNNKQIYISGHSSGGHLCGVAMTTDWSLYRLPRDTVKGGLCTDGMYDLVPVSLSARRLYVNFTPEVIDKLSAINQMHFLNAPIYLINGTMESLEFQRQTRDFAAALQAAHKNVTYRIGYGYNHFELPETLANPYGVLGRTGLEMMGLQPNMGKKDKGDWRE
jgi:arylformamidase